MATENPSPLALGNQAFRNKDYATAIEQYLIALQQMPALSDTINTNIRLARTRLRREQPNTPQSLATPATPTPKIAVVVHVYYLEIWPEIAHYLKAITHPFDLFVTTTTEQAGTVIPVITTDFPNVRINIQPNNGMDVLPFLALIPLLITAGYVAVCKLHTKRGDGGEEGTQWRRALLNPLIGDNAVFSEVVQAFVQHADLQLVGPASLYLSARKLMFDNEPNIKYVLEQIEVGALPVEDWGFFAGSMFWVRPTTLQKLAQAVAYLQTQSSEYQADGQISHAVERLLGLVPVLHQGQVGLLHSAVAASARRYILQIGTAPTQISQANIADLMRQYANLEISLMRLRESGQFDAQHYLAQNPGLVEQDVDLLAHYLLVGRFGGENIDLENFSTMISSFDGCDADAIGGWIINKNFPTKPLEIEIMANGLPIQKVIANVFRKDLLDSGLSKGFSAFHVLSPKSLLDGDEYIIQVREVSTGFLIGNCSKILQVFPNKNSVLAAYINFFKDAIIGESCIDSYKKEKGFFILNEIVKSILNNEDFYTLKVKIVELIDFIKLNEPHIEYYFLLLKMILRFIVRKTNKSISFPLTGVNTIFLFEVYFQDTCYNDVVNDDRIVYRSVFKIGAMTPFSLSILEKIVVKIYTLRNITDLNSIWMYDRFGAFTYFASILPTNKKSDFFSIKNDFLKIPLVSHFKVTVIIPVYQRYELLARLIASIFSDKDFLSSDVEVIIADDYPTKELKPITNIISTYGDTIKYYVNERNYGFLKNCNIAFKKSLGDIVILINSDIELPQNWFSRILQPFSDNIIALATPLATNGEDLTVTIPEGQNWRDIDRQISWNNPHYPDACTAIGYCLGIRKSAIVGDLFDSVYHHGYGEDSDLHYRLKLIGYRSIVVDNLLVLHDHGASYEYSELNRDLLRKENHHLFMSKWRNIYIEDIKQFTEYKKQWFPFFDGNLKVANENIDILFVSPSANRESGGVKVIFNLAEYLIADGYSATIVLDGDGKRYTAVYDNGIHVYSSVSALLDAVVTIKIVFSTCYDTIQLAEIIASKYKAKHVNLVQGPESLFDGGQYFSFYQKMIALPKAWISVSPFLVEYLKNYFGSNGTSINYGPNKNVFYLANPTLREKVVTISLNNTIEKGTGFALTAAKLFYDNGYHVIGFGKWNGSIPDWIEFKGWQSETSLAKIFNKAKFYIESSYYEGLGLLALEAAHCGVIPIIRLNGSGDKIFSGCLDNLLWTSLNDLYQSVIFSVNMTDEDFNAAQKVFMEAATKYNSENGYKNFLLTINQL